MRIIDLSASIAPSAPDAPLFDRVEIKYSSHAEGAAQAQAMLHVPPHLLRDGEGWAVEEITRHHKLQVANVFHAGDGNLHPLMLFDRHRKGDVQRVLEASHELLTYCVGIGGALTGEHGIGTEKRSYMTLVFNDDDLAAMAGIPADRSNTAFAMTRRIAGLLSSAFSSFDSFIALASERMS